MMHPAGRWWPSLWRQPWHRKSIMQHSRKRLQNQYGQVKEVVLCRIIPSCTKPICRTAQSWCTSIFTTEWTMNERHGRESKLLRRIFLSLEAPSSEPLKIWKKLPSYEKSCTIGKTVVWPQIGIFWFEPKNQTSSAKGVLCINGGLRGGSKWAAPNYPF